MSPAQQYIGFVFSESSVVAALWQQVGARIQIIARSRLSVVQEEKWIDAIDAALEELGSESLTVKKALFAVPSAWTQDGELIESKKSFLKELTTDLLLDPLGFVLVEDTLLAWQEDQLGKSFTGTVITNLTHSWVLQRVEEGNLLKITEVGKSGESGTDWNELSAQLTSLTKEHRRGLYLDLAPATDEYDQVIVKLRQLLQAPVEKIKPDQLAEISIIQGGREILSGPEEKAATVPLASDSTSLENTEEDEFQTPDFIISTPTLTEDTESEMISEGENEEELPSKKKSRMPKLALPAFSFSTLRFGKNKKLAMVGGALAAVLLACGIGYAVLFTRYTTVIAIELEGQTLERTETMALSENASDSAELFLALSPEVVQENITVEKEVSTTGTKITGEPAKGKVLIYNKTDDVKSFPAGTNLVLNGKTYKLDSDIQIASASSKESTGSRTIEFGSIETTAIASFIGPEGNIGKNERFAVANFSSSTYEAVSQEEFSGGSSREIQAVSAKDITSASTDLLADAQRQLEERFETQNTADQQVFFAGETVTTDTKTSANIDQEAKLVRVQLTVQGKAYKINKDKLSEVTQQLFNEQIPQGYLVQQSSIQLTPVRILPGTPPKVELKIQAKAVPDVQPANLQQLVAGEYAARAKTLLEESPGVRTAAITIKPEWAAALLPSIPQNSERVKFNLQLR